MSILEDRADACWENAQKDHDKSARPMWAIAAALFENAKATCHAADVLGTGNAATQMGAIEFHAVTLKETGERNAAALFEIATSLEGVCRALSGTETSS